MTSVGDKLTLDREELWQAVLQRDTAFDEAFVYAVRSTGIYCRPSCSSRKPKRRHVDFFRLPELAKQVGFRPWGISAQGGSTPARERHSGCV